LVIKSKLKKVFKEDPPFIGDLPETFPEYYNTCFISMKKRSNNKLIYFKYFTNDGKGDDEESEDSESDEESKDNQSKDLLRKEI
jgi:hypothetical protein